MINTTNNYKTAIKAAKRHLKAKVELYSGSSLVNTYTQNDALKSVTIDRVGEESKFFGFGVSHKFNIKLIDVARAINLTTDNYFKIYLGTEDEYITYPKAHITEVNRDENTNELSITAYDVLKDTKTATVSDLGLQAPYTIQDVVKASSELLGCNKYIKESKNLLNPNGNSSTANGITFTNNGDGSFTISGTATTSKSFQLSTDYPILKSNTNYTLSLTVLENSGQNFSIPMTIYKEDGSLQYNYYSLKPDKLSQTNLTDREILINAISVYIPSGYTVNATFKVQLEENEVATDYEPYYKTEVIYTGKNLLNVPSEYSVTGYNIVPINIPANTQFTISAESISLGGSDGALVSFKDSNGATLGLNEYLSSTNLSATRTLTNDVASIYIYSQGSYNTSKDVTSTFKNLMISKSGGEYEPYNTAFEIEYTDGANFEGTETIEEALRAAAEATQTIYYVNSNDNLIFKRLGGTAASITKDEYFTLDSKTNKRLQTICSATELGDNVSAATSMLGSTQYLRDNPFLELREDIATILDNAIAAVGNMTINQFSCEWRGDPSLEPGDKLELTTKDNDKVISYLLNDSLVYEGGLKQKTQWNYTDSEEIESTPSTVGEAIKQTRAKVDKVNKEITLLVSETSANTEQISGLTTRASGIEANVSEMKTAQETTSSTLETINNDITTLTNTVNAKVSAEDVKIEIQKEMSNGATSVKTTTGFTFDDNGLTIAKDGSEMTTNVDEDGISVYRDSEEVLTANNEGVVAYDLHAKTYLIVGTNSRFEDYEKDGEPRTGCFWIGETEVE